MSYEKRIDELIGQHVSSFQAELSLARAMRGLVTERRTLAMPYGYPVAVYRPTHICRMPPVKKFCPHCSGRLSNGVPKLLRTELVGQYILGVYNPPGKRTR